MGNKATLQVNLLDSGECEILSREQATGRSLEALFKSGLIGIGREFRVLERSTKIENEALTLETGLKYRAVIVLY